MWRLRCRIGIHRQKPFVRRLGGIEARCRPDNVVQRRLSEFDITATCFAYCDVNAFRPKISLGDGQRSIVTHQETADAAFAAACSSAICINVRISAPSSISPDNARDTLNKALTSS